MANIRIRTGEIGKKFNRLTLIENLGKIGRHYSGLYRCDCGNEKVNRLSRVETGSAKSCGCLAKETAAELLRNATYNKTHGYSTDKSSLEYKLINIHNAIKTRCYNQKDRGFKWYGARGIKMCDEWRNSTQAFVEWSLSNGYKPGLQIDRRENDGNYEPGNCRWITRKENMNNRRGVRVIHYNGCIYTISELSVVIGIPQTALYSRFSRGWDIERIINQTKRKSPTR